MAGYNAKMVSALRQKGIECKLVVFQEFTMNFYKKSCNKTEVIFAPNIDITTTKSLVAFIKDYRPSCVFSFCTSSLIKSSLMVSVPWIMQFYGSDIRWNKLRRMTRFLLRFYKLRKNRHYSVTTPDLLLIKKNAFHISQPLEIDFWKPIKIEKESNTIFFPHRFDDSNNVSLMMDIWDELKDQGFHLKLIDWGERIAEFKQRFGTANNTILDFMPEEKLREEINKSTVVWGQFAYPSLCYSDLYALACHKQLISLDFSNLTVKYNPPTIQCKTKEEIIARTLELMNHNTDNVAGRQWIIDFHDASRVASKVINIVQSINPAKPIYPFGIWNMKSVDEAMLEEEQ